MNLDIIAQLVQILKDAPELGAIEVRRGLFGSWSVVRLTKAGHQTNAGGQHVVVAQAPGAEVTPSAAAQRAPAAPGGGGGAGGAVSAPPSPLLEIDRKSTRLNSSHMSISYAVFCLKKKNPSMVATLRTIVL